MTKFKPGDRIRHTTITGLVGAVKTVSVSGKSLDVKFPFTLRDYAITVCADDFELDRPSLEEVLRDNPSAVVIWSHEGSTDRYVRAEQFDTNRYGSLRGEITAVHALGPELWSRDDG